MLASAETITNFDPIESAVQNIPARVAQPFEVGSTAVAPAIELRPYDGPGLAHASNTPGHCARLILKAPHLEKALMESPGNWHQQLLIMLSYDAVLGCDSEQRLSQVRPQTKKDGHWVNNNQPAWRPMSLGGIHSNEHREAGFGDVAQHVFDLCSHGHRERVRLQVRNLMRNRSTGNVKTGGVKSWPVTYDKGSTKPC